MTLPEPPTGQCRQLLQTVWDLAFGKLRWPTFAELDRKWDTEHDSDAAEVLGQLPEGFACGFDRRMPPQDSTAIGLTVAGAAACDGAQETLAAFLDFIRVAAAAQREWSPPDDDPDARPSLTDLEYARQARDLPAAGRADLLQLLFQLLKVEPCGWTGLSGPDADGHWKVTVDRRIRPFRGVAGLGDYWSRRHKPWESRPARATPAPTQDEERLEADRIMLLETYPEILASALLQWIYASAGGSSTRIVACAQFRPGISPAKTEDALQKLESVGQISLQWLDPAPAPPYAQLTHDGATSAELSARNWRNGVFRDRAARNALLAWIQDQKDNPQGAALVAHFLRDVRSAVEGGFLSAADIDAAAAYLHEKELIDGTFIAEQRGPVYAWLKAEGIDCIEHGGDVAAYLARKDDRGITYNFNAAVSGTNVAIGDGATQVTVTQGIDIDGLHTLIQAITEALPGLRLDPPDRAEAENTAREVIAEAQQPHPDRSRLRAALGGLRRVLASSAQDALATVLRALIDRELAKIGIPPAG